MLKGIQECLRRFATTQLIIIVCLGVLFHVVKQSSLSFLHRTELEVYNGTSRSSVSQESFEVIICPMPRVHVGRVMYFGESIPKMVNYAFVKQKVGHFFEKNSRFSWVTTIHNAFNCAMRHHMVHSSMSVLKILELLTADTSRNCWGGLGSTSLANYRRMVLFYKRLVLKRLDSKMMYTFLYKMFNTLDEGVMSDYKKLFDQMWQLEHENRTLSEWVGYISLNLSRQMDKEAQSIAQLDVTRPLQTIQNSIVNTRMVPQCPRYTFHAHQQSGFQRSRFTLKFKDHCPPEPAGIYPSGALCVSITDFYVMMYITPKNMFTDVSNANVIVPYRIAVDRESLLHVTAHKIVRPESRGCRNYESNTSRVMCMEDCLTQLIKPRISCIVPWIERAGKRNGVDAHSFPECREQTNFETTLKTIRNFYDVAPKQAAECRQQCPLECTELRLESRLIGSVDSRDDPRIELIISDELHIITSRDLYGAFQFICEVMGNISFIIGVSLVALYDWIIGLCLYIAGRIPFIPALPPMLKHEFYPKEECSCRHHDDNASTSNYSNSMSETSEVLARSFRSRPRTHGTYVSDHHHEVAGQRSSHAGPRRSGHRHSPSGRHHRRSSAVHPQESSHHHHQRRVDDSRPSLPSFVRRKSIMSDPLAKTVVMTEDELKRLTELHRHGHGRRDSKGPEHHREHSTSVEHSTASASVTPDKPQGQKIRAQPGNRAKVAKNKANRKPKAGHARTRHRKPVPEAVDQTSRPVSQITDTHNSSASDIGGHPAHENRGSPPLEASDHTTPESPPIRVDRDGATSNVADASVAQTPGRASSTLPQVITPRRVSEEGSRRPEEATSRLVADLDWLEASSSKQQTDSLHEAPGRPTTPRHLTLSYLPERKPSARYRAKVRRSTVRSPGPQELDDQSD